MWLQIVTFWILQTTASSQHARRLSNECNAISCANSTFEEGLLFARLSSLAYKYDPDSVRGELDALEYGGLSEALYFSVNSAQAYVFHSDSDLVISFRGENDDADSEIVGKIELTPLGAGKVHAGVLKHTQHLFDSLKTEITKPGHSGKKLWLTGHGLGGAMAMVMSGLLQQDAGISTGVESVHVQF